MFFLAPIAALALSLSFAADSTDSVRARRDVDSLLSRLRTSGCRFQRNGLWYDGATAADHLSRKRKYLVAHGGYVSAEDFIAKVGAKSSLTGRPYLVQCPDHPAEPSADWLRAKLPVVRKGP
jgi:hypothetical protein